MSEERTLCEDVREHRDEFRPSRRLSEKFGFARKFVVIFAKQFLAFNAVNSKMNSCVGKIIVG